MYSTLFSTGLHLQNSLLKLRHIEGLFEALEKSKDKESVSNFIPTDRQVLEWLQVGELSIIEPGPTPVILGIPRDTE